MKTILNYFMICLLTICVLLPCKGYSERGIKRINKKSKQLALVIGNGSYETSPLKNPVNDANDIAKTLKDLGFDVIHKENANQKTMEKAIREFGKLLHEGGVGLFYFAGHGMQVKGRNYLIPIGAEIESESDIKYETVDAGLVLGKMEDADNDMNIVILDACRNNPFARSFRSNNQGLAKMDAPKGSLVAYATAPGAVAADGEKTRNGVYTKYLLKYMRFSELKIEEVMKKVRIEVMKETYDKQIPWESSSMTGDFYFVANPSSKGFKPIQTQLHDTGSNNSIEKEKYAISEKSTSFDQVKVRHILVKSKQKAKMVIEKLKQGKNFSKLAQEVSLCPSGKKGGDLGWFGRGKMVAEFEEAAFNLKEGQLSDIIKTNFGYHVIIVDDKK